MQYQAHFHVCNLLILEMAALVFKTSYPLESFRFFRSTERLCLRPLSGVQAISATFVPTSDFVWWKQTTLRLFNTRVEVSNDPTNHSSARLQSWPGYISTKRSQDLRPTPNRLMALGHRTDTSKVLLFRTSESEAKFRKHLNLMTLMIVLCDINSYVQ